MSSPTSTPSAPIVDVQLLDRPVMAVPFDPFPQPAGAEATFLGRTRDEEHPQHGRLMRLSYDGYRPLAERVLHELAEEAVERFGCLAVRVHHALGDVAPGEASVLVMVAAGHRAEAFDACRWLIDTLKAKAPIWKREVWADGTTWSPGQPVQVADDESGTADGRG